MLVQSKPPDTRIGVSDTEGDGDPVPSADVTFEPQQ
jgi:hypothetical protein